jgi:hypothetical protein
VHDFVLQVKYYFRRKVVLGARACAPEDHSKTPKTLIFAYCDGSEIPFATQCPCREGALIFPDSVKTQRLFTLVESIGITW